jgi:hypothetical protein
VLLDEALVDFAGARAVVAGGVGEVLDGGLGEGREGLALRGPGGAEGVLGEGAGGDVEVFVGALNEQGIGRNLGPPCLELAGTGEFLLLGPDSDAESVRVAGAPEADRDGGDALDGIAARLGRGRAAGGEEKGEESGAAHC